jgi:outer membrane receptor protein involved in Fe transport
MKEKSSLLVTILLIALFDFSSALPGDPDGQPPDLTEEEPIEDCLTQPWVITSEEIENSGAMVLGEILGRLPGMEVLDRGYLGAEKEVSFQGFQPSRLLFILDGEVINNPLDFSLDINLIPLSAIEKIEVISKIRYFEIDTHTAGGIVKITTKRYHGGNPFTKLTFTNGSFHTNLISGSFSRGLFDEKMGLSLSFNSITTDGFSDEGEHSTFQYHFQFGEKLWKELDVTLSGAGTASSVTLPEESTGTDDVNLETGFQHINMAAFIMPEGPVPLEISAYYNENSRDSLEFGNPDRVQKSRGDRKGIRLKGLLRPTNSLQITMGTEEKFVSGSDAQDSDIFSIFSGVKWETAFLPTIEAMGRWEREGPLSSVWSGGLTASRSLTRRSEIFVSYMEASHLPYLVEEEMLSLGWERTIESGISYRLSVLDNSFKLFRRWSAVRSVNEDNLDDYIFSPDSELKETGWSVSTGIRTGEYLSISAGYQNLDVHEFPSGGIEHPIPRHYLTGTARVQKSFKDGNLKCSCLVSGVAVRGRNNGVASTLSASRDYHYLDLNMGLQIIDVTIYYNIRNVFNHSYEIVETYPMPGRVGRFGFTWNFSD